MHIKSIGGTSAIISLSASEADCLRSHRVPLIYGRGGIGPELNGSHDGPMTVKFGGAVFVSPRSSLDETICLFKAAMAARLSKQSVCIQVLLDEEAGFLAFPTGSFRKGLPDWPRCPFRRPERIRAWQRGIDSAHREFLAATLY